MDTAEETWYCIKKTNVKGRKGKEETKKYKEEHKEIITEQMKKYREENKMNEKVLKKEIK